MPEGAIYSQTLTGKLDFVQLFATKRKELAKKFADAKEHLAADGMIWISWPKKSSGVKTDLDENAIREIGLAIGLVDVKVCAVDGTWSGLKFVYRLKDRSAITRLS